MPLLDWFSTTSKVAFILGVGLLPILNLALYLLARSSIPYWSGEGGLMLVEFAICLALAPVGFLVLKILSPFLTWMPLFIAVIVVASIANGVGWAAMTEHLIQTRESSTTKFGLTVGTVILWWALVLGAAFALHPS